MNRREFTALVGGAVGWPLAARGQQPERMRRLGILLFTQQDLTVIRPCLHELERLGYVEAPSSSA
jgi:hypothetical protein